MTAVDVLDELTSLGITATASGQKLLLAPGSKVPQELLAEVKEHKSELLDLVTHPLVPTTACTCNPPPSQGEYRATAQAGCGTAYPRCSSCGYTWHCKLCGGCRNCRDLILRDTS